MVPLATTDAGPVAIYGTAQFAGTRTFNIFWYNNMHTAGLSLLYEIHHDTRLLGLASDGLVSNPCKHNVA